MPKHNNKAVPDGVGEVFTWEKDKDFRYLRCNENYAMAAGLDSPYSIIGKTDDDMPWRSLADNFRSGDRLVMYGRGDERLFVQEKEIMVDRVADILVNEKRLLNSAGECIGVAGSFMDISGHVLLKTSSAHFDNEKKQLALPEELGGGYLTRAEAFLLEKVVNGWTAKMIAQSRGTSPRTVEGQMGELRKKLRCKNKADLVVVTQRYGLHFTLHEISSLLVRQEDGRCE